MYDFIHLKFTELDRKIAFTSGLFLITTTVIAQYVTKISNKTKTFIMNKIYQDLAI